MQAKFSTFYVVGSEQDPSELNKPDSSPHVRRLVLINPALRNLIIVLAEIEQKEECQTRCAQLKVLKIQATFSTFYVVGSEQDPSELNKPDSSPQIKQ